jgi:hypothetical protein
MNTKKILISGTLSGLVMGVALFIGGVTLARIIYGPDMAPEGKFDESQMNAFYFIWTKLLIGIFFGVVFTFVYEKLPINKRIKGGFQGVKYSFIFWLVLTLWDISHPFTYGSIYNNDQLFWLLYTLCGFLAFGFTIGIFYKKYSSSRPAEPITTLG